MNERVSMFIKRTQLEPTVTSDSESRRLAKLVVIS